MHLYVLKTIICNKFSEWSADGTRKLSTSDMSNAIIRNESSNTSRIERVLAIMYITQNNWICELCPVLGILSKEKTRFGN